MYKTQAEGLAREWVTEYIKAGRVGSMTADDAAAYLLTLYQKLVSELTDE